MTRAHERRAINVADDDDNGYDDDNDDASDGPGMCANNVPVSCPACCRFYVPCFVSLRDKRKGRKNV